ncbi:hypothetical protein B0J11DRAFT_519599 [Dendryphion nanum]|uniref:DnaJ homologue subfamily C member 28 conserved domain-containing protein n=1 Tax=Dendryphion nanum TaxID=256645 RepID=A0A9P9EAZ9_9PLEO|nr:hypothetical protein B0J11DRAFT_519599 [Dendryphion nanum]
MLSSAGSLEFICAYCSRANRRLRVPFRISSHRSLVPCRRFSHPATQEQDKYDNGKQAKGREDGGEPGDGAQGENEGAMTQRLRDMSEEALESGGRGARKAVSEAGFSEDLKRQLEERIASSNFRAENRNAFAEAELPSHAGRGTRGVATADAWTGEESVHDSTLRMLNDAHKPLRLRRPARMPGPAAPPPRRVDTGRAPDKGSTGTRLANARDRSGMYSSLKESDIDELERQKRFQLLKDRFSPNARSIVPGTIQGLSSLANERIEDAIARGQFKNLPRGQKIERDYNASSPFLDTTEYFLNKIIQKQEIVPPWIEKQQELVSSATKFRARLRNDWKRHAARTIASAGGTLAEQMRRADAYAKAEMIANPQRKKTEEITTVDESGQLSQISLSGELKVPLDSFSAEPVVEEVVVAEWTALGEKDGSVIHDASTQRRSVAVQSSPLETPPAPYPFRDPAWEATESAYQTLAINDLNNKTRSYNLQAPDLAKKPYFSLQRELNACYADVAPQLAEVIKQRALYPKKKLEGFGESLAGGSAGVMDRLVGEKVKVRDERVERRYGFRQFWKDVWSD